MNLISMARPQPQVEETAKTTVVDSYYEKYPWGLRITLNNDELAKLGLDVTELEVDTEMLITAKALITGISINKNSGEQSDERSTLDLQIIAMSVTNNEDFGNAFNEAISA